jgi:hypothetical protein
VLDGMESQERIDMKIHTGDNLDKARAICTALAHYKNTKMAVVNDGITESTMIFARNRKCVLYVCQCKAFPDLSVIKMSKRIEKLFYQ